MRSTQGSLDFIEATLGFGAESVQDSRFESDFWLMLSR